MPRDLSDYANCSLGRDACEVKPKPDRPSNAGPILGSFGGTGVRLLWIVALSLSIFAVDMYLPLGAGVGVSYIAVVLSSLWLPRARYTWIAAVISTTLTIARMVLESPESIYLWSAVGDRALSLFAIWTVAILGLWQKRTTRAQSVAQAEAIQAQKHNSALKGALVRTEAAEAQLRRGQRLIDTVAEMARIGGWELDLTTMRPIWSQEVYRIHDLAPSMQLDMTNALDYYAPDARPVMEKAIKDAIEHGTQYDLTVPFISATGRRRWVRTIGVAERTNGVTTRLSGAFQDVTEQHETQIRLARASRSSSEGHWDYDFGTETVWCSATFEEIFGNSPKDVRVSADQFTSRTYPEDQPRVAAAFEKHIAENLPYDVQIRMRVASGTYRWFRVRGAVERDDLGRLVSFAGSCTDIHEDKLAQEELRVVRQRFERAIHGTQDGLWEWDVVTNRIWLSPRYATLLGYTVDELPTNPAALDKLVAHPDDVEHARQVTEAHFAGNSPYDLVMRLRTRSGEYRWFRSRGTTERDGNGTPLTLSGSIQDITAQKTAETARIEAEQRLERAIRGSSDGFFEHVLADNRVWYSQRVREMLGYGPNDVFPDSLRELTMEEDRVVVEHAQQRHFEHNETYDVVHRLPTRQGTWRWFRARGICERDDNGKPTRFSGSIQDITTQREAEAALVAAKEASAAANRAKGDFLANMSHEIRTPMNGVLGMTELLLDTPLEAVQREFAETIRTSATSLLGVLNDVLDFSKIEAGKLDIESVEMDVRGCVEDVGAIMAVQAAAKNLEFIVNVDPALPDMIFGDPHRLRQILTNLLGNAIKFTREGEVIIEVLAVGAQAGRTLLHFEVRDSGIGMSSDVVARLFQPFVQADGSTTRHYGGTGLGLSIVKRLVDMMGGQVGVVSGAGKGSTFSFTLPCQVAEGGSFMATATFSPRGKRALVVDDNPTNRRVLCGQLQPAGYEVETVASADEAFELLVESAQSGRKFDVVIADDQMPGHDGAALATRVKAVPALAEIPLIMLTSLDRFGNVQRLTNLGFAGYLTKPVRGRELRACIERVLEIDSAFTATGPYPRLVTRGSLAGDKFGNRYHGHVLVVEDNMVNQQVTRRFLDRLGCEVTVAENGLKAVQFCAQRNFDLILMDVQMPIMDGLVATREIRKHEGDTRRTPIVALTASAMTDELERCLAAGMDGLLTKPLEPTRLRETLDRHGLGDVLSEAAKVVAAAHVGVRPAVEPIDLAALRALVGDDTEFMQDLCKTFLSSSVQIVEELKRAVSASDRASLGAMAHKLKGGSGSVCAQRVVELATSLEKSASSVPLPELTASVDQIRAALDECAEFIEAKVA